MYNPGQWRKRDRIAVWIQVYSTAAAALYSLGWTSLFWWSRSAGEVSVAIAFIMAAPIAIGMYTAVRSDSSKLAVAALLAVALCIGLAAWAWSGAEAQPLKTTAEIRAEAYAFPISLLDWLVGSGAAYGAGLFVLGFARNLFRLQRTDSSV